MSDLADESISVIISDTNKPTSAAHTKGSIVLLDGTQIELNCLMDTGALNRNYISRSVLHRYAKELEPYTTKVNKFVALGDSRTLKPIHEIIDVQIRFPEFVGYDHKAGMPCEQFEFLSDDGLSRQERKCLTFQWIFEVFETGNDCIIGLPTILTREFFPFFVNTLNANYHRNLCAVLSTEVGDNLIDPYPIKEPDAPEDLETPLPVIFEDFLNFMETSVEEAEKEYFEAFDSHIDPAFDKATQGRARELLRKYVRVFVPTDWTGINGFEDLEFQWKSDPGRMKPAARPVNKRLEECVESEINRLKGYMLVESHSCVASPAVIAPKATPPYIRFCGDFTKINLYIEVFHWPIPHVQRSLEKIAKFRVKIDLDMTNSFHQIRLARLTSERLSIVTKFGQYRPLFMPEGCGPASGHLQRYVTEIFAEFEEWTIILFDNFLILAHDEEDALKKMDLFLAKCIERNVHLKFAKSWIGMEEVTFFGYVCKFGSYRLSEKRSAAILAIPFPANTKQMQSFLGAALFFKSFVNNYSSIAAPLNDMVHKDFNWKSESWTVDYHESFRVFKAAIANACSLFYPDYDLDWVLRTDASERGVGAVLLQNNAGQMEPISFLSKKFSVQAQRWPTIEQECFAIYFAVQQLSYYLRAKSFVLETDHRNLIWMSQSMVPKVMRWHSFLQSFNMLLRHIPGKLNVIADMLSRLFELPAEELSCILNTLHSLALENIPQTPEELLRIVHGGRAGHLGGKRTLELLNKMHPGHGISMATVMKHIEDCPVCQKDRHRQVPTFPSEVKTIFPDSAKSQVAMDVLKIKKDANGFEYLQVIINLYTKFCALYPIKNKDAKSAATSLFQFICSYGLFDQLRTDPGSDYTSEIMEHLLKWLGPTHSLTLVDNPQADGVEGSNKQILRHIKALAMDERIADNWSDPTVLPIIQLIVNEHCSSETGVSPMHATFGDVDGIYKQIPDDLTDPQTTIRYVSLLAENLRTLRDISAKHIAKVVAARTGVQDPESANRYQPGDFVLKFLSKSQLPDKLKPRNAGPYRVVSHIGNNVTVRDLISDGLKVFHNNDLMMFRGNADDAFAMAQNDNDQFVIAEIFGHQGNPELRTTMQFWVLFADGSKVLQTWSHDLYSTEQYERYCDARPELRQLNVPANTATLMKTNALKSPITLVKPGDLVYVDIRSWNTGWYANLTTLPDHHTKTYVTRCVYGALQSTSAKKKDNLIQASFPDMDARPSAVDNWFVSTYGHTKVLNPDFILLTYDMVTQYKLR